VSFGHLNSSQLYAIQPLIQGREVHDLGCGDRTLSRQLVRLGVKCVVAELILYGSGIVTREPVLEERAGMDLSRVFKSVPAQGVEEA
jgi:hypothetical protein